MSQVPEGRHDDIGEIVGVVQFKNASAAAVEHVLAADEHDPEGRSQWLWCRLPNGDVLLGVFPQGDTYLEHQEEHP